MPASSTLDADGIAAVVDLARLSLDFARVDRATFWPDGKTPESDTDHTVMLGLVACAVAAKVAPRLDLGLVAQFSYVHDLVEAICGDTDTKDITAEGRAAKADREHAALEQLRERFVALPWIAATIDRYERLSDPEARFVKVLDKVLPKITHILSGCAVLVREGRTPERLRTHKGSQREALAERFPDQTEALALLVASHDELIRRLEAELAKATP